MSVANDNEELPHLRYFLEGYWHQCADLVYGELGAAVEDFASREKVDFLRGVLADLSDVRRRDLFAERVPESGPKLAFWAGMGDRVLSEDDAELIRSIVERHLG